jgi:CubicO group peptidase (beta-lactamase class C family)
MKIPAVLVLGYTIELLIVGAGANCPPYPYLQTISLPSPLPAAIQTALSVANQTLSAALLNPSIPGFAVSAYYNGQPLQSWGGGAANISLPGVPPSPTAGLFRIASNTKIFISLLAHILDAIGYYSMDDPIQDYMPFEVINPFDAALSPITARMLASHSSGLPDSLPGYFDWTNITTAEALQMLQRTPLQRAPYTMPSYSNLGFALLGHYLAEFVMKNTTRIGDLIQEHILTPLNLTQTGYYYDAGVLQALVPGYDSNGDVVPFQSLGWGDPCGCMYSNVADMAKLGQVLSSGFNGNAIPLPLSPAQIREFFQPLYYAPDGSFLMATPWETLPVDDFVLRTKSGTLEGYATKTAIIPELSLSITFCFNGNFADWYYGQALISNVTSGIASALQTVVSSLQPPRSAGNNAADFVGTYIWDGDSTVSAVVSPTAGTLLFQMTGDAAPAFMQRVTQLNDTFLLYYNSSASDCEHVFMGDVGVGTPVLFFRNTAGNVTSFQTINFSGSFTK